MQTFVPLTTFRDCAQVLDDKRLGKQRVECLQLLRGQWPNHPASRMWRGYTAALAEYALAVCDEWYERGYLDRVGEQVEPYLGTVVLPPWWGGPIHASHRSNLLRKLPSHYSGFGWSEPDNLPYVWPV